MSDLALAGWLAMIVAAVAIVSVAGREGSASGWVAIPIVLSVVIAERFPVRVGRIRYAGSDFAVWLAIPILGAWPAVAIASAGILIGSLLRRVPGRLSVCNVAVFSFAAAVGSALLAGLHEVGFAVPGEAGLPVSIFLLAWAVDSLNLLLLVLGSPLMRGVTLREAFKEQWLPVLPWMTLTAGVAAGTVHAYYTLGPAAVALAVVVHGGAQALLKTIEREERQRADVHAAFAARDRHLADALEAEARERRRVALELHDDALQNLVIARQDIAEGAAERADERLAAAIAGVRRLAARQYEIESGPSDLPGRLRELVDAVAATCGMDFTIDVRVDTSDRGTDDLLVSLARELVVNAGKHSGGSRVDVEVGVEGGFVVLAVSDDGTGFDPGSAGSRLREDHLGLAVAKDRLAGQGGGLEVSRSAAGGARVTARLPFPGVAR